MATASLPDFGTEEAAALPDFGSSPDLPDFGEKEAAPLRGFASAAVTSAGNLLKGTAAALTTGRMEPAIPVAIHPDADPETLAAERQMLQQSLATPKTPSEKLNDIRNDPLFRLGQAIEQQAPKVTPQQERSVWTKIGEGAGGLLPAVAGPAAPLTMGAASAGEHISADYDQAKANGLDDDTAAQQAMDKSFKSGAFQAGLFYAMPPVLRGALEKYFVDKFGRAVFTRWLTGRLSAAGEGAALGASSQAGENVIEDQPATDKLGQSAGGLALLNALLPWLREKPRPRSAGEAMRGQEPPPPPEGPLPDFGEQPPGPTEPTAPTGKQAPASEQSALPINKVTQAIEKMRRDVAEKKKLAQEIKAALNKNQINPTEEPNANPEQSPVEEVRRKPEAPAAPPQVATREPGEILEPARAQGRGEPPPAAPGNAPAEIKTASPAPAEPAEVERPAPETSASDVRGLEQSVQSEPGAAPATPTPAPEPVKPKRSQGIRARQIFDKETDLVGPDLLEWIQDTMPMMSKSWAKKNWPADKYRDLSTLWDDAPKLSRPHHNVIYAERGSTPDQVAEAAYREGKIAEPSVNELWREIEKASELRGNAFKQQAREEAALQEEIEQHKRWRQAKATGEIRVDAEELQPGDQMVLAGEEIEVSHRDPESGDVTLQDGTKFGKQTLSSGDSVYVEKLGDDLNERLASGYGTIAQVGETKGPEPATVETEHATKEPETATPDKVQAALERAIEATKPGTAWTGQTSIGLAKVPVWLGQELAHNALKVVLEAWKAGKSVVHAIEAGIDWIRERGLNGFNEQQARDWLTQYAKEAHMTDRPAGEPAPKTYDAIQKRRDEISARIEQIDRQRRGAERTLPDELRSERYQLSREQLDLQRQLNANPEYVADLLREMEATGRELENARAAGNGLHVREASDRLRNLMDTFESVPEDLRMRTYNDLLARGELLGSGLGELKAGRTLPSLTAWLAARKLDSPKVPWSERLNLAKRLADEWSRGKDAATRVWARAMAGWKAFKEQYQHPPVDDDFRSLLKDWFHSKDLTGLELDRWARKIVADVPQKLRRWAISVWLDADGNADVLHSQRDVVPEKYRHIWDAALQLTPDEQALARRIKQDFAEKLEDALNLGLVERGREHYGVPQLWKKPPEGEGAYDPFEKKRTARNPTARLDPRDPFFSLQRTNPTYFDGIMAGGEPKTLDIGALVAAYDSDFHNALADRGFIKALRNVQVNGTPAVMISGSARIEPRPEGSRTYFVDSNWRPKDAVTADGRPYRSIDHWALRGWKFASRDAEGNPILVQGDFLVHPDIFPRLKNELGTSWLRDPEGGGKYFNPILKSGAFLKASKFASATFHMATIGEHAMFHLVSPITRGVELNPERNPKLAGLMRNGMDLGFGSQRELFEEGLLSHGGIWAHVPGLGDQMGRMSDWLFRDYIPKIKAKTGLAILERNLKRYRGQLSEQQIYELTAQQVNAAFGVQNWRLLGTNKTLLDVNRLFLTAPDFLLSRAKVVAQALKPYNAEQRYFLLAQAAIVYTASRALNLLLDDDPHWEPENALSVIYHGRAYSARFIVNDLWHLAQDPASFASGRLGPLSRTFIETATQRDMRTGTRIEVPFETDSRTLRAAQIAVKDMAMWLVPVGFEGALPGAPGREQTGLGQLGLGLVGVGSRRYTPETQVRRWAADFNRHSDNAGQLYQKRRDTEAHAESDYRKLDVLLDANKLDQARQEYQELIKEGHNDAGFDRHFATHPFTGQGEREQKFKDALSQAQKEIYDRAIAERKERLARFQQMKQLSSKTP